MDELGFNKIAAAVLATALGVMFLREAPHFFMHAEGPDAPVYSVGPIEVASTDAAVLDLPFPQADWVNSMDAERGAKVFKKCQSCHNVEAGGSNGTGPALYGVVGNTSGTHAGFTYSTAMATAGYAWDYEQLDGFLKKPSKHMKGTKMSFAGLKKPADRAAVIEYLRVNAPAPVPRPEAAPGPEDITSVEAPSIEGMEDVAVMDQNGIEAEAVITDPSMQNPEMTAPEGTSMTEGAEKVTEGAEKMMDDAKAMTDDAMEKASETMEKAKDAMQDAVDQ